MKKIYKLLFILILFIPALVYLPCSASADAASLYLSPGSLTETLGSDFTIYVGINANGNPTDAWKATVYFPSDLEVTGTGQTSYSSLCPEAPTVSGNSVSFQCGAMAGSTGYGATGNIIYVSVKAVSVGTGSASMADVQVLAGPGNDVTGSASGGTYTVNAASSGSGNTGASNNNNSNTGKSTTPAPNVTSSTHPDQNSWYNNNTPDFSWNRPSGVTGFSYVFDQSPGTDPGQTVNTTNTGTSFTKKADGTWYFHIRAVGPNGWSSTTNYRVQIDTTAPYSVTVVTDPKGTADVRPIVSFNALDATSGIAYYKISMDMEPFQQVTSPYLPSYITSGSHIFYVEAFDLAGNMAEGQAKIYIKQIAVPTITKPQNHAIINLVENLNVTGKANKDTTVDLYFDGVNIARSIKVGSNGEWQFNYQKLIFPGSHKIVAIAVKDGIQSQPSKAISIRIDATAISLFGVIIPSWIVMVMLLFIIGILIFLCILLYEFGKNRYNALLERVKKRNTESRRRIAGEFIDIQDDLKQDVQRSMNEGRGGEREHKIEQDIETKVKKEIEDAEGDVEKIVGDETKDLK